MQSQNNKYTEKMVTKAIIDKLSSIMIKDSIAKQLIDQQDHKQSAKTLDDQISNSTINVDNIEDNLVAPSLTINAHIGKGSHVDEREYLITDHGIFSQSRSIPYAQNAKLYYFTSGVSENYHKMYDNLTSGKLTNIANTASTQANKRIKTRIASEVENSKADPITKVFKHAKQAMDEKLQLVFDGLDDSNKHQL